MSKGSDFLFGRTKCPELYKSLDDIAREVNTKLRMRGVGKGFVCVQEDLNKLIIDDHLLSRLNSQIGRTRHFATFHLMQDFIKTLPKEVWEYVYFDKEKLIFKETENCGRLRNKNSLSGSQLFRAC